MFSTANVRRPGLMESKEIHTDYQNFCRELQEFSEAHSEEKDEAKRAKRFLAERWTRIWNENRLSAYPSMVNFPSTQFCLQLAKKICRSDENYYQFLMPTLQNVDVLLEEIDDQRETIQLAQYSKLRNDALGKGPQFPNYATWLAENKRQEFPSTKKYLSLSEIFLTDDQHAINIEDCFSRAEKESTFYYTNVKNQTCTLTLSEIFRIENHSVEAREWSQAIQNVISCGKSQRHGYELDKCIQGCRNNQKGNNGGSEYIAGNGVQLVVGTFAEYLHHLPEREREEYLAKADSYGNTIRKTLERAGGDYKKEAKKDQEDLSGDYCITLIADDFENIKQDNPGYFYSGEMDSFMQQLKNARETWQRNKLAGSMHYLRDLRDTTRLATLLTDVQEAKGNDLQRLFASAENDRDLVRIWKHLTHKQKNCLAEVLEKERLLSILQQQKNTYTEMEHAMAALEHAIKENDGPGKNIDAETVLNEVKAGNRGHMPILTELLHRTAVGVRHPENTINTERYPVMLQKLGNEERNLPSRNRKRLVAAGLIFLGVVLLGVGLATLILAMGYAAPFAIALGIKIAATSWAMSQFVGGALFIALMGPILSGGCSLYAGGVMARRAAKQELVFRKTGLAAGGFFKEKLEIPAVKQVKRRQGSSIQEGDDKPKSSLRRPLRSTGSV